MTKDQLKAKYARISHDDSQLEMFKNDLIDGEIPVGGGSVDIAGNSLVIPEAAPQPLPEPVATIDGVDYYHKIETKNLSADIYYDMYGNEMTDVSCPYIRGRTGGGTMIFFTVTSVVFTQTEGVDVAISGNQGATAGEIQIVSPTAYHAIGLRDDIFTAGYLELDEEYNGTLYFNLVSDVPSVPEYVSSIKQGNAIIPLKDDRLPAAEQVDAGKVLKVAAAGGYELGEAGGDLPFVVIDFSINSGKTFGELAEVLNMEMSPSSSNSCTFYNENDQKFYSFFYTYYGQLQMTLNTFSDGFVGTSAKSTNVSDYITVKWETRFMVPDYQSLDNTKTFVLKCVNGTLSWVEEQA